MRTRCLALALLMPLSFAVAQVASAQVPVKLFTANDGQKDTGTSQLAAAVRKHLADMPKYRLWQGGPSAFPKNGVLLDIQGMDVTDRSGGLIGSAAVLVCSVPDPQAAGYYAVRYRELLEIKAGDDDIGDAADDFLAEMDKRIPVATATKAVAPVSSSAHSKVKSKKRTKHSSVRP